MPRASAGYARLVLFILFAIYVLNFLDRQLLSILAKPIQDDLGVSDGQLGRLGGLYFALFYCILGVPVAWLADRGNRVRVLVIACALWSAATIACGMAHSYPQLAAARMSVGIGEAGGVPPSYAIITDYFPPDRRGSALALFNLGPTVGQASGVAFGAAIAAAYDWRLAFLLLGAIGIVAASVAGLVVREPARGATDRLDPDTVVASDDTPGFWLTVRFYFSQPALVLVALAAGATQFVTYATLNFTTLLLMREKGMTLDQVAIWYALLLAVAVGSGIVLSGRLLDRYAVRFPQVHGLLPALGLALAIPFFVGFVAAPHWPAAMLFLAVPTFLHSIYLTPSVALVQSTVPARQRTLAGAILLLIMNLIGLGLGPTYLGAMSDWFRTAHPDHALQLAFYSLVPFYLPAIALYLALARRLRRDHALRSGGQR